VDGLVILSRQEGEYLLHALEASLEVTQLRQLFLWSQGPLQALLPHRAFVCVALDMQGKVARTEFLQGGAPAPALAEALCDPQRGLARLLLARWVAGGAVRLGEPMGIAIDRAMTQTSADPIAADPESAFGSSDTDDR